MTENFVPHVVFGLDAVWVSLALLAATYGIIVSGRHDRAVVALLAGAVAILIGALDQGEAIRGIDWDTIGLLAGMMIVVGISRRSGLFQYLAVWSAQRVNASPAGILLMLQIVTVILSAFLNNVSTVLLVVPVTLAIAEELHLPAFPFLFAEVFASNIGGTATLVGDPPNILIGTEAGLDFNAFLANVAPVVFVVVAVQAVMIQMVWGRSLKASPECRALVMGMNARGLIVDVVLMRRTVLVLAVILAAFVFAKPLRLEPATIAMTGAGLLMLADNWRREGAHRADHVHQTFAEVEWSTIFFFIGLFVVVRAVEATGVLRTIAVWLVGLTAGHIGVAGVMVLWGSALLSAVFDNIPFVATMIPLIKAAAPSYGGAEAIRPLWWCLSLGACLGGNGTLTGASANLAVAGVAARSGVAFSYLRYLMWGAPMMLVSILISQLYVWLRYF
jgi:Na+/H+ antiporter NhaD/arsenite permease-like protein